MVVSAMNEDQVSIQKYLISWWTEETTYLLQRLERWALPHRYNKLHSPRISRGCMTMQNNHDNPWSCSSSDSNSLQSSKKHNSTYSPDEVRKINCCRTFYQSNNRFDSSCLDDYRYDHSIYFKTIGDIKNNKRISSHNINKLNRNDCENSNNNKNQNNCHEVVFDSEDDVHDNDIQDWSKSIAGLSSDCWNNYRHIDAHNKNNNNNIQDINNNEESEKIFTGWPIVDMENLNNKKNCEDKLSNFFNDKNFKNNNDNKQFQSSSVPSAISPAKTLSRTDFMRSIKKNRRTKSLRHQPVVFGENNVTWPSVLFSYNLDSAMVPTHHRSVNVK